jgi:5-methylcytosine-specific restriction endonuclease McrA
MDKSLYNKEYYKKNIERLTLYRKERYQKNREKDTLYAKEYRKNHPNYNKDYHQKNKEKEKQYHREYYIKNRDKILNYFKKYNRLPEIKKIHRVRYGAEYQQKYRVKNKEKLNLQRRNKRHEKGISKGYKRSRPVGSLGLSNLSLEERKIRKKAENALYKERFRNGGKLTIKDIQQIYEDNIKQYSTLTCYLCLKPIEFGKDSLDHKIPLSRGGTNIKENLAIAHMRCNYKKHNKTEQEYQNMKGALIYHGSKN